MYKEIIEKIKPELEKVISFLEKELQKIRTSRVSPSLVEDITVDYSGQKFSLKELGTISCPESRQVLIQPWDKSYIEPIEKAISRSGLGASPIVEKDFVRIKFPPLTEDFRKDILHGLSSKKEQSRETVRRWRQQAWDEVQEKFKQGDISEDDKYKAKKDLQDLIDEYNKKIEDITEMKKKEIEN